MTPGTSAVSPITFLSDYGYVDEFAGACRAVLARLAPGAPVVDLTHGIPAGDVRRGALALEAIAPCAGAAVHLAVVDPGVGTARRAVAIATADGSALVGPDNGLLALAAGALGGVRRVCDISHTSLRLEPVAPTFHGRDLFAPAAAHLACGRPLEAAGELVDPASLVQLELPQPKRSGDALVAHVLYADGFGNLVLDARAEDLESIGAARLSIEAAGLSIVDSAGEARAAVRGATFADGRGGLVVYDDSSGRLAIALDGGSAAGLLGAGGDDTLTIGPAVS